MEKISKALKCVECKEILEIPAVLLPCYHSICQKHVSAKKNSGDKLKCDKCEFEHDKYHRMDFR